jgi:transmembrane sensor
MNMLSWFRNAPRDAAQWVVRVHAGPLNAADQAALEAWLERRPEHRRAYERAGLVWDLAHGLSSSAVAHRYLVAESSERRRPRPRTLAFGLGAGLAAALLALAILPERGVHTTGIGEIQTVTLEDGSVVWLNADSRLRVDFSGPFRRVVLDRGEAFFKVAHDTGRPFVVEAAPRRIVVTGTEFDVRRAPDSVEVSGAEGHVKVEAAVLPGQPVVALSAGEDARFAAGEAVPAVAHGVIAQHKGAWREGKIYLDDLTLGAALDEVNRYSQTKLVLGDESLRQQTINGSFKVGDIDSVLFALRGMQPLDQKLEVRREPGRIVLYTTRE